MSTLSNLLLQIEEKDPQLATDVAREVKALSGRRAFGLNFERHIPAARGIDRLPLLQECRSVVGIGNSDPVGIDPVIDLRC